MITRATTVDDFFDAMSVKDTGAPVPSVTSAASQRAWWRMCDRRRVLIAGNTDLWGDVTLGKDGLIWGGGRATHALLVPSLYGGNWLSAPPARE
jgi:hypothetical protein